MPPTNFIDLTGQVFGTIVVVERAPSVPGRDIAYWSCRFECGHTKALRSDNLRARKTMHCGCRNPFRGSMRAGMVKATGNASKSINALVSANDAMRQALDDELMARMGR